MKSRYQAHKDSSKRRGIPFHFTFEEWIAWWEKQLGPDWINKRGCHHGQYVMARKGDKGPYHPSNVVCVKAEQNRRDAKVNGTHAYGEKCAGCKLTNEEVVEIFHMSGNYVTIGQKYNISFHTVSFIKKGRRWKHITGPLLLKYPHVDGHITEGQRRRKFI